MVRRFLRFSSAVKPSLMESSAMLRPTVRDSAAADRGNFAGVGAGDSAGRAWSAIMADGSKAIDIRYSSVSGMPRDSNVQTSTSRRSDLRRPTREQSALILFDI